MATEDRTTSHDTLTTDETDRRTDEREVDAAPHPNRIEDQHPDERITSAKPRIASEGTEPTRQASGREGVGGAPSGAESPTDPTDRHGLVLMPYHAAPTGEAK